MYEAPEEVGGAPLGLAGRWLFVEAKAPQRTTPKGVTPDQLAEAERGARQILARKFSHRWIAAHVHDLVGQANLEYAEWLEDNEPADNPIGWLINCVWWRALNRYESESRKPPTASLDAVVQLQDKAAPNPERELLDHERQERLRKAISHLDEKEQRLLALVYFEDYSIREAGRKLGWGKSSVDRHHKTAMDKMRALVGERSLLSPATLGPAVWIVVNAPARSAFARLTDAALAPVHNAAAFGSDAVESGAHRLGELGRRLWPFADAGNAAAAGGGGRVLGYCGAAAGAVACGLLGSGVVGPGVGGLTSHSATRHEAPAKTKTVSSQRAEAPTVSPPPLRFPTHTAEREKPKAADSSEASSPQHRKLPSRYRYPTATTKQSTSELGNSNFGSGSPGASSASSEAAPEAPVESAPAPAPSGGSGSGSRSTSEFGL